MVNIRTIDTRMWVGHNGLYNVSKEAGAAEDEWSVFVSHLFRDLMGKIGNVFTMKIASSSSDRMKDGRIPDGDQQHLTN